MSNLQPIDGAHRGIDPSSSPGFGVGATRTPQVAASPGSAARSGSAGRPSRPGLSPYTEAIDAASAKEIAARVEDIDDVGAPMPALANSGTGNSPAPGGAAGTVAPKLIDAGTGVGFVNDTAGASSAAAIPLRTPTTAAAPSTKPSFAGAPAAIRAFYASSSSSAAPTLPLPLPAIPPAATGKHAGAAASGSAGPVGAAVAAAAGGSQRGANAAAALPTVAGTMRRPAVSSVGQQQQNVQLAPAPLPKKRGRPSNADRAAAAAAAAAASAASSSSSSSSSAAPSASVRAPGAPGVVGGAVAAVPPVVAHSRVRPPVSMLAGGAASGGGQAAQLRQAAVPRAIAPSAASSGSAPLKPYQPSSVAVEQQKPRDLKEALLLVLRQAFVARMGLDTQHRTLSSNEVNECSSLAAVWVERSFATKPLPKVDAQAHLKQQLARDPTVFPAILLSTLINTVAEQAGNDINAALRKLMDDRSQVVIKQAADEAWKKYAVTRPKPVPGPASTAAPATLGSAAAAAARASNVIGAAQSGRQASSTSAATHPSLSELLQRFPRPASSGIHFGVSPLHTVKKKVEFAEGHRLNLGCRQTDASSLVPGREKVEGYTPPTHRLDAFECDIWGDVASERMIGTLNERYSSGGPDGLTIEQRRELDRQAKPAIRARQEFETLQYSMYANERAERAASAASFSSAAAPSSASAASTEGSSAASSPPTLLQQALLSPDSLARLHKMPLVHAAVLTARTVQAQRQVLRNARIMASAEQARQLAAARVLAASPSSSSSSSASSDAAASSSLQPNGEVHSMDADGAHPTQEPQQQQRHVSKSGAIVESLQVDGLGQRLLRYQSRLAAGQAARKAAGDRGNGHNAFESTVGGGGGQVVKVKGPLEWTAQAPSLENLLAEVASFPSSSSSSSSSAATSGGIGGISGRADRGDGWMPPSRARLSSSDAAGAAEAAQQQPQQPQPKVVYPPALDHYVPGLRLAHAVSRVVSRSLPASGKALPQAVADGIARSQRQLARFLQIPIPQDAHRLALTLHDPILPEHSKVAAGLAGTLDHLQREDVDRTQLFSRNATSLQKLPMATSGLLTALAKTLKRLKHGGNRDTGAGAGGGAADANNNAGAAASGSNAGLHPQISLEAEAGRTRPDVQFFQLLAHSAPYFEADVQSLLGQLDSHAGIASSSSSSSAAAASIPAPALCGFPADLLLQPLSSRIQRHQYPFSHSPHRYCRLVTSVPQTYCINNYRPHVQPTGESMKMVQCCGCGQWLHWQCAGLPDSDLQYYLPQQQPNADTASNGGGEDDASSSSSSSSPSGVDRQPVSTSAPTRWFRCSVCCSGNLASAVDEHVAAIRAIATARAARALFALVLTNHLRNQCGLALPLVSAGLDPTARLVLAECGVDPNSYSGSSYEDVVLQRRIRDVTAKLDVYQPSPASALEPASTSNSVTILNELWGRGRHMATWILQQAAVESIPAPTGEASSSSPSAKAALLAMLKPAGDPDTADATPFQPANYNSVALPAVGDLAASGNGYPIDRAARRVQVGSGGISQGLFLRASSFGVGAAKRGRRARGGRGGAAGGGTPASSGTRVPTAAGGGVARAEWFSMLALLRKFMIRNHRYPKLAKGGLEDEERLGQWIYRQRRSREGAAGRQYPVDRSNAIEALPLWSWNRYDTNVPLTPQMVEVLAATPFIIPSAPASSAPATDTIDRARRPSPLASSSSAAGSAGPAPSTADDAELRASAAESLEQHSQESAGDQGRPGASADVDEAMTNGEEVHQAESEAAAAADGSQAAGANGGDGDEVLDAAAAADHLADSAEADEAMAGGDQGDADGADEASGLAEGDTPTTTADALSVSTGVKRSRDDGEEDEGEGEGDAVDETDADNAAGAQSQDNDAEVDDQNAPSSCAASEAAAPPAAGADAVPLTAEAAFASVAAAAASSVSAAVGTAARIMRSGVSVPTSNAGIGARGARGGRGRGRGMRGMRGRGGGWFGANKPLVVKTGLDGDNVAAGAADGDAGCDGGGAGAAALQPLYADILAAERAAFHAIGPAVASNNAAGDTADVADGTPQPDGGYPGASAGTSGPVLKRVRRGDDLSFGDGGRGGSDPIFRATDRPKDNQNVRADGTVVRVSLIFAKVRGKKSMQASARALALVPLPGSTEQQRREAQLALAAAAASAAATGEEVAVAMTVDDGTAPPAAALSNDGQAAAPVGPASPLPAPAPSPSDAMALDSSAALPLLPLSSPDSILAPLPSISVSSSSSSSSTSSLEMLSIDAHGRPSSSSSAAAAAGATEAAAASAVPAAQKEEEAPLVPLPVVDASAVVSTILSNRNINGSDSSSSSSAASGAGSITTESLAAAILALLNPTSSSSPSPSSSASDGPGIEGGDDAPLPTTSTTTAAATIEKLMTTIYSLMPPSERAWWESIVPRVWTSYFACPPALEPLVKSTQGAVTDGKAGQAQLASMIGVNAADLACTTTVSLPSTTTTSSDAATATATTVQKPHPHAQKPPSAPFSWTPLASNSASGPLGQMEILRGAVPVTRILQAGRYAGNHEWMMAWIGRQNMELREKRLLDKAADDAACALRVALAEQADDEQKNDEDHGDVHASGSKDQHGHGLMQAALMHLPPEPQPPVPPVPPPGLFPHGRQQQYQQQQQHPAQGYGRSSSAPAPVSLASMAGYGAAQPSASGPGPQLQYFRKPVVVGPSRSSSLPPSSGGAAASDEQAAQQELKMQRKLERKAAAASAGASSDGRLPAYTNLRVEPRSQPAIRNPLWHPRDQPPPPAGMYYRRIPKQLPGGKMGGSIFVLTQIPGWPPAAASDGPINQAYQLQQQQTAAAEMQRLEAGEAPALSSAATDDDAMDGSASLPGESQLAAAGASAPSSYLPSTTSAAAGVDVVMDDAFNVGVIADDAGSTQGAQLPVQVLGRSGAGGASVPSSAVGASSAAAALSSAATEAKSTAATSILNERRPLVPQAADIADRYREAALAQQQDQPPSSSMAALASSLPSKSASGTNRHTAGGGSAAGAAPHASSHSQPMELPEPLATWSNIDPSTLPVPTTMFEARLVAFQRGWLPDSRTATENAGAMTSSGGAGAVASQAQGSATSLPGKQAAQTGAGAAGGDGAGPAADASTASTTPAPAEPAAPAAAAQSSTRDGPSIGAIIHDYARKHTLVFIDYNMPFFAPSDLVIVGKRNVDACVRRMASLLKSEFKARRWSADRMTARIQKMYMAFTSAHALIMGIAVHGRLPTPASFKLAAAANGEQSYPSYLRLNYDAEVVAALQDRRSVAVSPRAELAAVSRAMQSWRSNASLMAKSEHFHRIGQQIAARLHAAAEGGSSSRARGVGAGGLLHQYAVLAAHEGSGADRDGDGAGAGKRVHWEQSIGEAAASQPQLQVQVALQPYSSNVPQAIGVGGPSLQQQQLTGNVSSQLQQQLASVPARPLNVKHTEVPTTAARAGARIGSPWTPWAALFALLTAPRPAVASEGAIAAGAQSTDSQPSNAKAAEPRVPSEAAKPRLLPLLENPYLSEHTRSAAVALPMSMDGWADLPLMTEDGDDASSSSSTSLSTVATADAVCIDATGQADGTTAAPLQDRTDNIISAMTQRLVGRVEQLLSDAASSSSTAAPSSPVTDARSLIDGIHRVTGNAPRGWWLPDPSDPLRQETSSSKKPSAENGGGGAETSVVTASGRVITIRGGDDNLDPIARILSAAAKGGSQSSCDVHKLDQTIAEQKAKQAKLRAARNAKLAADASSSVAAAAAAGGDADMFVDDADAAEAASVGEPDLRSPKRAVTFAGDVTGAAAAGTGSLHGIVDIPSTTATPAVGGNGNTADGTSSNIDSLEVLSRTTEDGFCLRPGCGKPALLCSKYCCPTCSLLVSHARFASSMLDVDREMKTAVAAQVQQASSGTAASDVTDSSGFGAAGAGAGTWTKVTSIEDIAATASSSTTAATMSSAGIVTTGVAAADAAIAPGSASSSESSESSNGALGARAHLPTSASDMHPMVFTGAGFVTPGPATITPIAPPSKAPGDSASSSTSTASASASPQQLLQSLQLQLDKMRTFRAGLLTYITSYLKTEGGGMTATSSGGAGGAAAGGGSNTALSAAGASTEGAGDAIGATSSSSVAAARGAPQHSGGGAGSRKRPLPPSGPDGATGAPTASSASGAEANAVPAPSKFARHGMGDPSLFAKPRHDYRSRRRGGGADAATTAAAGSAGEVPVPADAAAAASDVGQAPDADQATASTPQRSRGRDVETNGSTNSSEERPGNTDGMTIDTGDGEHPAASTPSSSRLQLNSSSSSASQHQPPARGTKLYSLYERSGKAKPWQGYVWTNKNSDQPKKNNITPQVTVEEARDAIDRLLIEYHGPRGLEQAFDRSKAAAYSMALARLTGTKDASAPPAVAAAVTTSSSAAGEGSQNENGDGMQLDPPATTNSNRDTASHSSGDVGGPSAPMWPGIEPDPALAAAAALFEVASPSATPSRATGFAAGSSPNDVSASAAPASDSAVPASSPFATASAMRSPSPSPSSSAFPFPDLEAADNCLSLDRAVVAAATEEVYGLTVVTAPASSPTTQPRTATSPISSPQSSPTERNEGAEGFCVTAPAEVVPQPVVAPAAGALQSNGDETSADATGSASSATAAMGPSTSSRPVSPASTSPAASAAAVAPSIDSSRRPARGAAASSKPRAASSPSLPTGLARYHEDVRRRKALLVQQNQARAQGTSTPPPAAAASSSPSPSTAVDAGVVCNDEASVPVKAEPTSTTTDATPAVTVAAAVASATSAAATAASSATAVVQFQFIDCPTCIKAPRGGSYLSHLSRCGGRGRPLCSHSNVHQAALAGGAGGARPRQGLTEGVLQEYKREALLIKPATSDEIIGKLVARWGGGSGGGAAAGSSGSSSVADGPCRYPAALTMVLATSSSNLGNTYADPASLSSSASAARVQDNSNHRRMLAAGWSVNTVVASAPAPAASASPSASASPVSLAATATSLSQPAVAVERILVAAARHHKRAVDEANLPAATAASAMDVDGGAAAQGAAPAAVTSTSAAVTATVPPVSDFVAGILSGRLRIGLDDANAASASGSAAPNPATATSGETGSTADGGCFCTSRRSRCAGHAHWELRLLDWAEGEEVRIGREVAVFKAAMAAAGVSGAGSASSSAAGAGSALSKADTKFLAASPVIPAITLDQVLRYNDAETQRIRSAIAAQQQQGKGRGSKQQQHQQQPQQPGGSAVWPQPSASASSATVGADGAPTVRIKRAYNRRIPAPAPAAPANPSGGAADAAAAGQPPAPLSSSSAAPALAPVQQQLPLVRGTKLYSLYERSGKNKPWQGYVWTKKNSDQPKKNNITPQATQAEARDAIDRMLVELHGSRGIEQAFDRAKATAYALTLSRPAGANDAGDATSASSGNVRAVIGTDHLVNGQQTGSTTQVFEMSSTGQWAASSSSSTAAASARPAPSAPPRMVLAGVIGDDLPPVPVTLASFDDAVSADRNQGGHGIIDDVGFSTITASTSITGLATGTGTSSSGQTSASAANGANLGGAGGLLPAAALPGAVVGFASEDGMLQL